METTPTANDQLKPQFGFWSKGKTWKRWAKMGGGEGGGVEKL